MNPFVFACIAPHGGELIPELQGSDPSRMALTRDSMKKLGKYMRDAKPEYIIILTPHGTRINGRFSIMDSERMEGSWKENNAIYRMEKRVVRNLARAINEEALKNEVAASTINFGTSDGPISCLPLDWGAIVPLRFMPDIPIVVITPSRELSFKQHIEFGGILRKVVAKSTERVGLDCGMVDYKWNALSTTCNGRTSGNIVREEFIVAFLNAYIEQAFYRLAKETIQMGWSLFKD